MEYEHSLHESVIAGTTSIWPSKTANQGTFKAIPSGYKCVSVEPHGHSAWSASASVTTETESGHLVKLFVKHAMGGHGKAQLVQDSKRTIKARLTHSGGRIPEHAGNC